jgi:phosphate-selective porin OprO/OprP
MSRRRRILIGCLLLAQACVLAQAQEPSDSLLIRNVRLFDRDGAAEDVVASLLVKNGKLDLVTKDEIPASEASLVLDARNGVVIGNLHIGEPASFLILDDDPRENVEVLLDTKTHAGFAIHQGVILKNTLREVTEAEPEEPKRGWLAYQPPPLVLPLSYQDNTKWNRWETKHVSGIFLAAVVFDRQRWFSRDGDSRQQFGSLSEFDGGEIRGFRIGAAGTLNFKRPWVYTIFAATHAFDKGFDSERDDDFTFFDYRLDIPLPAGTTLSVGKQKEPISLERITSMTFLPMQERSAVADALLPSRNFGVVLSGTALGRRMTWAGGAFNDWIDHGESFDDNASQFVGRLTWLPFVSADEDNLVHLGLGLRYTNAKEGLLAQTEPEFNNAPLFVETGLLDADDSVVYDLEASWRAGPFWLAGEYLTADVDSPALGDPSFDGYHVTASWALSGEMRSYNRRSGLFNQLRVSRSVYEGGWGTWELGLRWSELDLTDGAVEGGEMQIASFGVNWWLSPIFNVNFNYRHVNLDRFGLDGDTHGFNTRVLLVLE